MCQRKATFMVCTALPPRKGREIGPDLIGAVDQELRRAGEVVLHLRGGRIGRRQFAERRQHVAEPVVPLPLADGEGKVSRPQAGMAVEGAVATGAAEELGQEEELAFLARLEGGGEERPEDRVVLDAPIKAL